MRKLSDDQLVISAEKSSLERYLREIHRIPLLSIEEETRYARLARENDTQAMEILIKANLRFVVTIAKTYQNKGLTLMDLVCEGNRGLIKAANRFDETKGFKFISFAVWWIRQTIMLAIAEQTRNIKIPLNAVSAMNKMQKAEMKFEQQHERLPTMRELAEEIGIAEEGIRFFTEKRQRTYSMDAIYSADIQLSLHDLLRSTDPATDHLVTDGRSIEDYRKLFKTLSKKECRVLILHYGLNNKPCLSLEEIGILFNLSRERIRQMKDKGINKIRIQLKIGRDRLPG
ncbi:sigma-70 family RNA polymerase sigma factor [Pedobacter sp. AW31-3R]|uniref:sigma-70 family RNA polymerase sigma factor n=1 Tax=Pedobacter sp. AW31-3R TaxID=3445781 RepID=UPI003F9F50D5